MVTPKWSTNFITQRSVVFLLVLVSSTILFAQSGRLAKSRANILYLSYGTMDYAEGETFCTKLGGRMLPYTPSEGLKGPAKVIDFLEVNAVWVWLGQNLSQSKTPEEEKTSGKMPLNTPNGALEGPAKIIEFKLKSFWLWLYQICSLLSASEAATCPTIRGRSFRKTPCDHWLHVICVFGESAFPETKTWLFNRLAQGPLSFTPRSIQSLDKELLLNKDREE